MRLKFWPLFLWLLLAATPGHAGCEGVVGDTVQISDVVVEAEILTSGDNRGMAVYTFSGTGNNLDCGGNAMFLYDRSGQLKCAPGKRVSAAGTLELNYVYTVMADSVSCD